jgi:hypothetical protein
MYRSNFLHDWITEPIPPFVKIGGFNELAELNNIIVLYPQTRPTIPNPLGCFDAYESSTIVYPYAIRFNC